MKYAITYGAFMPKGNGALLHTFGISFVLASSKDEAMGKAYRICRRFYPPTSGWADHHFSVRAVGAPDALISDDEIDTLEPARER